MDSEHAETYLRNLAESELRRLRGILDDTDRVRAVAAAFAQIGLLNPGLAESIVDDLATALEIRCGDDSAARSFLAHQRDVRSARLSAVPAGPVSVTPASAMLELRDGETDMDVYLLAAISTPTGVYLSTGIHSLPKGSRRPRQKPKRPMTRRGPRRFAGWPGIPGVPDDLIAVDDAGRSYDVIFSGGGDDIWATGQFNLLPNTRGPRPSMRSGMAWLHVGNDENSVRIDLTARPTAVRVTTVRNSLSDAERFLRTRAEALVTNVYQELADALPGLAELTRALLAVGGLPDGSKAPGLIAALCDRYAVPRTGITGPPTELPDRWVKVLPARDRHDRWDEPDRAGRSPAAAHLSVTFPELDGVTTVLSGLITTEYRTTLHGVLSGVVEQDYPDGPCLWLRDDTGQWHVARPGNWNNGDPIVFAADVVPPLAPSVTAVDILVIGRTAEVRASVPVTWWTS